MSKSRFTTLNKFDKTDKDASKYMTGEANPQQHGCLISIDRYNYYRASSNSEYLPIHRLVAVAEYGFDEVDGNHVHHKNGVRFDNRPSNLEVLSNSEHTKRESNNTPLAERLERATDEHIKSSLRRAGYHLAAEAIENE